MQCERAARQHREVEDGDEERNGREPALADDLAAPPHLLERHLHAGARLVPAAKDEERIVGEAGLVEPEQADRAVDLQTIDEAHDDVRLAVERSADGPELAVHGGRVARRRVHEADARQPVQVVVSGHVGADRTVRPRRRGT